ncbi:MAG: hypothetical protein KAT16_03750 [Candidatus Heimdallarchaeota archaeon]|nr:hypothetical protein [Candidatus Heimdallarchaeota archaeon]
MSKVVKSNPIGKETILHQKLKLLYCTRENIKSESIIQVNEQKFRIDVLNDEQNIIYEIQRSSFGGRFSKKIQVLLDSTAYTVRIVHPVIYKQKISRMKAGERLSVSYRNLNSTLLHLFDQLVYFKVLYQNRLEFDILLVYEHITKELTGYTMRSNRRKFRTEIRDLIKIVDRYEIRTRDDFLNLLPSDLPEQFTNQDLASKMTFKNKTRKNYRLPGRITYSLCQLGLLKRAGKKRNAYLFQITNSGNQEE